MYLKYFYQLGKIVRKAKLIKGCDNMNFFKQYLKFINYSLIGLAFSFTSFYIFTNIFHYLEINKDYVVDFKNYALVTSIDNSLNKVKTNLDKISNDSIVKDSINSCVSYFNNSAYMNLKEKNKVNIVDVYNLTDSYENQVVNNCFNISLSFLRDNKFLSNSSLAKQKDIINLTINNIIGDTFFLKKELLDNSNYYFNMDYDNNITKNKLDQILSYYNRASTFLLYISEWYSKGVN